MTKPFIDQEEDFTYDKDFFDEFFTEEDMPKASTQKGKEEPVEVIPVEEPKEEPVVIPVEEPEEESEVIPVEEPEEDSEVILVEEPEEDSEVIQVEELKEEPEVIPVEEPVAIPEEVPVEEPKEEPVVVPARETKKASEKRSTGNNIDVPIPFAKKRKRGWMIPLAAVALCLIAFVGFVFYSEYMTYASIYMSINPTVRIDVNRKDVVIDLEGVNADGNTMIENYSYQKKDVETVVDELMHLAMEMGYIMEGGTIKLTLDSSHGEWIQKHKDSLNELVNAYLASLSESMNIQVEMEEVDSSASTESGFLNHDNSNEEDEGENDNRPNNGNNANRDDNDGSNNTNNGPQNNTTSNDNTENNTTVDDTTNNTTTEDNTTNDNISNDATEEDNTTGDTTTEDDTVNDNTSSDATEEDNTTSDTTEKEDTTTEDPVEDDTTVDDDKDDENTDSDVNVGNGGMIIDPNSVEDAEDVDDSSEVTESEAEGVDE